MTKTPQNASLKSNEMQPEQQKIQTLFLKLR